MNAEDQSTDGASQPTSKSGPVFLGLSRCQNCYKHKAISWKGVDGESSSSAEDSGPEVESEEEESSSSSSCSEKDSSEILEESETEKPSPVCGDSEESSEATEDKSSTKEATQRAPLVKSFSLPASLTPRLAPLFLLPRPRTVVSTLHLQVEKHDEDAFHIVKQQLTEEREAKEEARTEGGRGGIDNQRSQPTLQKHQLSYQYQQQPPHQQFHQHQQQQPQHFPPLSAQGQMLPPPPLHTLPVLHHPTLNAPQRYYHSQPCLYCSSMQLHHSSQHPYWSHCSNGQLHR